MGTQGCIRSTRRTQASTVSLPIVNHRHQSSLVWYDSELEEQKLSATPIATSPADDFVGEAPPPAPPMDIPDGIHSSVSMMPNCVLQWIAPCMDVGPSSTDGKVANVLQVKKDHKPGVKLKPLHWAKISAAQMRGTIWVHHFIPCVLCTAVYVYTRMVTIWMYQ